MDKTCFIINDNDTPHITVRVRVDGRVDILGPGNTSVATSTVALVTGTFYYIEVYVNIDNSSGAVDVHVNEVSVATYSGDTQGGPNSYATNIQIGQGSGASPAYVSDLYVHSTRFLGDIKVRFIKPNGDGTYNDFSLSTGSHAWQVLDDVPPNADTDYILSDTPGDKTSTAMEDVSLDGTCEGIQVLVAVRKDEANVRKIKTLVVEGGTTTEGDEESIPTGYYYALTDYDINPRTGSKWTETELNNGWKRALRSQFKFFKKHGI